MIDLHIHTNNSDGSSSVIEILQKAEEKGLECIAITDHESINGHLELKNIDVKKYYSGEILKGAELKNYYKGRVIDILAYDIDIDKFNEYLKTEFKQKTHKMLETKNLKHFYEQGKKYNLELISIEELEWNPEREWASVTFYKELKRHPENEKKVPKDLWESFENFKKDYVYNKNNMFFLDKKNDYPSPKKTVEQIHLAGGKAFLAHVYEYKWIDNKIDYIKQLIKDSNLDGIECYYSNFTKEQTSKLVEFCKNNNLYISGGSDYHGLNKPKIDLGIGIGNLNVPNNILDWHK